MIGMKLSQARTWFFDRQKVIDSTDRATRQVLSRFGAFVRTTARSSIRRRKGSSKPGQPPSSHTGLLKRFIFFGYDRDQRSVVIGPAALSQKKTGAPEVLEHGGVATIEEGPRKTRTKRKTRIAARPYMQPAFEKEQAKLPAMWRDSVR